MLMDIADGYWLATGLCLGGPLGFLLGQWYRTGQQNKEPG